jgi:hypothetical protein
VVTLTGVYIFDAIGYAITPTDHLPKAIVEFLNINETAQSKRVSGHTHLLQTNRRMLLHAVDHGAGAGCCLAFDLSR